METSLTGLNRLKTELPFDPVISLTGIYPKDIILSSTWKRINTCICVTESLCCESKTQY